MANIGTSRLNSFHVFCLRMILESFWQDHTLKKGMLKRTRVGKKLFFQFKDVCDCDL